MAYKLCTLGTTPFIYNGVALSGGKIYTYQAGTSTPKATYTDNIGATAHANPVVLDSNGVKNGGIWLNTDANYKIVVKTSADVTIATYDNVEGISVATNELPLITVIEDENENEVISFSAVPAAINYLTVTNSATGNAVSVTTNGDDTNVNLSIDPKGTGTIELTGNTTVTGTLTSSSTLTAQNQVVFSGAIIPTELSASVNDYNPTNLSTASTLILTTNGSPYNITGLAGGAEGRIITIRNGAGGNITLTHEDASSTDANRFYFGNNLSRTLEIGDSAILQYLNSRWCILGASMNHSSASQAQQEAGASTTVATTPGVQQYHPSAAKAWVRFTSGSTTISASYNVASLTNNGTGDTTVNFTTAFSSANYGVAGIAGAGTGTVYLIGNYSAAPSTTAYRALTYGYSLGSAANISGANLVFFGDQ